MMSGNRTDIRDRIGRVGNASRLSAKRDWGVVNETPPDVLDSNKAGCFLRGSVMGKSLYEKFGFKSLAEFDSDLSPWGWNKEYWSYYMQRDPLS